MSQDGGSSSWVATPERGGSLPSFDGLRGLAATAIVLLHASIFSVWFSHPALRDLLGQLRVGVEVFFVISGFLLYRPFIAARLDGRTRPGWRSYAVNRTARLFPAYWVALVFTVVVLGQGLLYTPNMWISHLLLVGQLKEGIRSFGLPVSWTLTVELGFYVMVPFLAAFVDRALRRMSPIRAEVVAISVVAGFGVLVQLVVANVHNYIGWVTTPFYLPVFAVGMAFALVHEVTIRRAEPHWLYTMVARRSGLAWVVGVAVLVLSSPFVSPAGNFSLNDSLGLVWALTIAGACFCVPAAFRVPGEARRPSVVERMLNQRAIVYLGVISYGIYLWHYQILTEIRYHTFGMRAVAGSALFQFFLTFAITVAVATASWFLLERPIMRFVRSRQGFHRATGRTGSGEVASPPAPEPTSMPRPTDVSLPTPPSSPDLQLG